MEAIWDDVQNLYKSLWNSPPLIFMPSTVPIDFVLKWKWIKNLFVQIEHEDWWTRTKFFHQRRRDLLIGWSRDRAELLNRVKNVFSEACLAQQLEDAKQENRQKQQEFCDYLYTKVCIIIHAINIDASPLLCWFLRSAVLPWFHRSIKKNIMLQGGFASNAQVLGNNATNIFHLLMAVKSHAELKL